MLTWVSIIKNTFLSGSGGVLGCEAIFPLSQPMLGKRLDGEVVR